MSVKKLIKTNPNPNQTKSKPNPKTMIGNTDTFDFIRGEVTVIYNDTSSIFRPLLRHYMGIESYANEESDIVVEYENGDVVNLRDLQDIILSHNHFVSSYDHLIEYFPPIDNRYCNIPRNLTHKHTVPSRFNCIYNIHKDPAFIFMRIESSDNMPRFAFMYRKDVMNQFDAELAIKSNLCGFD